MASSFNQVDDFRRVRFLARCGAVLASVALSLAIANSAWAAQKAAMKTGASAEAALPEPSPLARDMPAREVELVVVWGFRLRQTEHDLRMASVRSGYAELVEKAVCQTSVCGFVVVQDGSKWRATNVIAASESELSERQRDMERAGSTLVIVYPTGVKRVIPSF